MPSIEESYKVYNKCIKNLNFIIKYYDLDLRVKRLDYKTSFQPKKYTLKKYDRPFAVIYVYLISYVSDGHDKKYKSKNTLNKFIVFLCANGSQRVF